MSIFYRKISQKSSVVFYASVCGISFFCYISEQVRSYLAVDILELAVTQVPGLCGCGSNVSMHVCILCSVYTQRERRVK